MAFIRLIAFSFIVFLICGGPASAATSTSAPLTIGESWVIDSSILKEKRRINVYRPSGVSEDRALPVLYMPDGGLAEDFLHIAGLLQVGTANGTTRPFILVGIENTERRRDLTGPTSVEQDRRIAPRVGGSTAFRTFIRNELMPEVDKRYRVTKERAIVGESLAGLFVMETLIEAPDMFDTYIALDPSLWWNGAKMLTQAGQNQPPFGGRKNVYIGSSKDGQSFIDRTRLDSFLGNDSRINYRYEDWLSETHATIYHPAALKAFRIMFPVETGDTPH
jgi:predicted alpha/beta superfamily hydrolase